MAADELLTKDEMDALMEGVARGAPSSQVRHQADDGDITPYELVSPENVIAGLGPVLETIWERFAHHMEMGLFDLLRREVEVTNEPVITRPYQDFITALSNPCSAHVMRVEPLAGPGLLVFEQPLVFMVVDTFFGGQGRNFAPAVAREFTATELRLIRRLSNLGFNALTTAFAPFLEVQAAHAGDESNPQFITAINAAETLLVVTLKMGLKGNEGLLHLGLPVSMFEPVRGTLRRALTREHPAPTEGQSHRLREGIKDSRVEVRAHLAHTEITLGELLGLTVGDFIPMEVPAQATLESGEIALYSAHYGVSQGCRALKIEHNLTPLKDALRGLTGE
ncbi:MAG: flagellar motor switch protein FliM [Candidatus Competibacteraceae bacterium]|nr:flagellar motor switch protein FliM [Candidatus Competibacteraceae bacterium]